MTDPATLINQARDELALLSSVRLSELPSQSRRDLAVVAHLLQAARRRCGIQDEPDTKRPARAGR